MSLCYLSLCHHMQNSLPRPRLSQAKRNRAERVAKMATTNQKRRLANLRDQKRRQAQLQLIKDEKEFIRAEKKRIKDDLRRERQKLAEEKRKMMRLKKGAKVVQQCSPEKAADLSRAMARLVPTSAEISNMSHSQYASLRSQMSKVLSAVRLYAQKCSPGFEAKKRSKPAAKRCETALNIPLRQTFIPNIGVDVPDKIPVSEKAFNEARKRLHGSRQVPASPCEKPRKKRRIAPVLVAKLAA